MAITKTHIYWGLGITAGITTLGIIIYRNRKKVIELKQRAESWLRPVAAKITSKFGYRTDPKTGRVNQFHNGIDLGIPANTQIKSPMPGTVENVYSSPEGGNQLIIKHNNGYVTGYAHLTKALVKKGDKIRQGEIVALSGNTGKSTGPHLHFTLKDGFGNWLDPAKVIYSNVV